MKCECFDRVNKMMCEKLEDPTGSINSMLTFSENKVITRPCVTFVYHKKNKDGSRQQKQSQMEVAYGYCPFCGKAYEHDKVEEK